MRPILKSLALVLLCAVSGCAEEQKSFPISESDVRQQLLEFRPSNLLFGGASKNIASKTGDDGSVVWTVSDGFRPELRFTATITPVEAGQSRVAIDVQGASDDPSDPRNVRLNQDGDLKDLYKTMMEELVTAELENRPPDMMKFQGHLQSSLNQHFTQVSASADRAAQASYKLEREDKERMEREREAAEEAAIKARRREVSNH